MLINQGVAVKKPRISRPIRTRGIPLKNGLKIGKRRELGENSGENSSPCLASASGPLKNIWRELCTDFCCWPQYRQEGAANDYWKISPWGFKGIPRIYNQRADVPYLPYQQKDVFVSIRKWSCPKHRQRQKNSLLQNQNQWCVVVSTRAGRLSRIIQGSWWLLQKWRL